MKQLNDFEKVLFKKIINSYISTKLVEHHLESYNNLINFGFQRIFDNVPPIIINHKEDEKYVVRFGQVYIDSPFIIEEDRKINYITPNDARLRDLYYESNLYVDIQEEFFNSEDELISSKFLQKVYIASIPTMINSCKCNLFDKTKDEKVSLGECENDPGGFFIIKGKERVLIGQERINYNQLYVFKQKEVKPVKVQSKSKVIKPVYIGEIRSMSEETGHSVLIQCKITKEGKIYFSLPYVKQDIPAGIVFKAYGYDQYENLINNEDSEAAFSFILFNMEKEASEINTQEEALDYIGNFSITPIPKDRKVPYAKQILDTELFPHLGTCSSFEKVCILGNMINKVVLTFLKVRGEDDRYNISMKRVEMPGLLIGDLFRMLLKRNIENIKKYLIKRQDIMTILAKNTTITNAIRMNFATGAWGIQKNNYIRNGVSQVLSRLTYSSMLSHLRRVVIPIGREGKNTKIRQLHPTQIFFICPAESPESSCVGIVKNLAMLSRTSIGVSTVIMKEILNNCKNVIRLSESDEIDNIHSYTKVMLNGSWFGITKNKDLFIAEFYHLRKSGLLQSEVSFSYDEDDNEVKIFSDEGRFLRALFTMKDNKIFDYKLIENIPTSEVWDFLVEKDCIRYVDANEVENSLISMFPEVEDPEENYSYCEIHPSMMLGVCASSIPYSANSQSPRNCYQCIEENEPVLMGDGTKKKIKDIAVGDSVVSVNPITYEKSITKVINQYVKPTSKNIVKVITIRCKKIVTTEDHLFLTDRGWKRAQDLIINLDKVCINDEANVTFEEVISIDKNANVIIADITTESKNHSFIAGDGFVVHNSSMFKQAIGTFALSYQVRVDTVAHVLMYPQKRLVSTTPSRLLKYDDMPAGINAIVAVCCYSGLNQEDSIIVNKGSVDRGMFHSTVYKTIACEERKKSLNSENIEIPSPDIRIKSYNYLKLDESGIIKEGAYVNKNDVLIGKTLTKTNKQDGVETKIECSLVAKQSEEGIVDKVFHLASQDGYRLIKVRIRQLRIPEIGDKLASTAAQKSTIGAVFNQEDMPFTRDGITPDLIINPMCLPGRMTINQLIECVIGKACSVAGKTADATPFTSVTNNPINQVKSELDKYGFNNLGNEVMMNGMTGEIMDAEIFIGPTYYQRLKHLVKDKLHSRARGSVQLLTNQPNSGRASEGGLNLWSSWKKFITKIQLVLCEGQHT